MIEREKDRKGRQRETKRLRGRQRMSERRGRD